MRILLVSYGDVDYDGRLRSLINVFSHMGELYIISRGSLTSDDRYLTCNLPYYKFIIKTINFAKKLNKIDWLILDNRKATIPGMIIMQICKPTFIIQDCRELYLIKEVKYFSGKVGCIFEKMMAKKADIVICANKERCNIMQQEYKLNSSPISYENIRTLNYESDEKLELAKKKLDPLINEDEIRIISSSGCSIERTNDVLVRSIDKIDKKCRLFLVGDSKHEDITKIKDIITEKKLKNVNILGRLNQTELKYLINRCHIGIVNYGQYDTNNIFCASGKIYEFLYEGIPVVTTSNPPLKRICEDYGIGIADNEYYNGINKVLSQYNEFKNRVKKYTSSVSIKDNDEKLINEIKERIKK